MLAAARVCHCVEMTTSSRSLQFVQVQARQVCVACLNSLQLQPILATRSNHPCMIQTTIRQIPILRTTCDRQHACTKSVCGLKKVARSMLQNGTCPYAKTLKQAHQIGCVSTSFFSRRKRTPFSCPDCATCYETMRETSGVSENWSGKHLRFWSWNLRLVSHPVRT